MGVALLLAAILGLLVSVRYLLLAYLLRDQELALDRGFELLRAVFAGAQGLGVLRQGAGFVLLFATTISSTSAGAQCQRNPADHKHRNQHGDHQ